MPRLSIIIPTHNRPDKLGHAVESALNQTLDDLEVIIVDDGSTPAAAIGLDDPRVSLYRHETPKGVSSARNKGLSLARSPYVAFLDDDDTLVPDYAHHMLDFMRQHQGEIDFAWPALNVVNICTGKRSKAQRLPCLIKRSEKGTERSFVATAYIRTTGMFFLTESIRQYNGFDENLSVSEDRELIFRMLANECGCGSVSIPLVNFFIHPSPRLSTNEDLASQARCDAMIAERHGHFISQHPILASRYLNLLARRQKKAGLWAEYRATLLNLIRIRPFDIRALKRLCLLFLVRPRS